MFKNCSDRWWGIQRCSSYIQTCSPITPHPAQSHQRCCTGSSTEGQEGNGYPSCWGRQEGRRSNQTRWSSGVLPVPSKNGHWCGVTGSPVKRQECNCSDRRWCSHEWRRKIQTGGSTVFSLLPPIGVTSPSSTKRPEVNQYHRGGVGRGVLWRLQPPSSKHQHALVGGCGLFLILFVYFFYFFTSLLFFFLFT